MRRCQFRKLCFGNWVAQKRVEGDSFYFISTMLDRDRVPISTNEISKLDAL